MYVYMALDTCTLHQIDTSKSLLIWSVCRIQDAERDICGPTYEMCYDARMAIE